MADETGGSGDASSSSTGATPTTTTHGSTASSTDATEGTSDVGDSDSTAADSASSEGEAGSSGGPGDVPCGNGIPDAFEACDDGNQVNGDGCNVDCVVSGSERWSIVLMGASLGRLAVDDEGGILVSTEYPSQNEHYDRDGAWVWSAARPQFAAIHAGVAWHPERGWLFAGSGDVDWVNRSMFQVLDASGTQTQWFLEDNDSQTLVGVRAVAFDAEGFIYASGWGFDGPSRLLKLDVDGTHAWSTEIGYDAPVTESTVLGLEIDDDGDVWVAGTTYAGAAYTWVRRYGGDGAELWRRDYPEIPSAMGLALHPAGGFVLAGTDYDLDDHVDPPLAWAKRIEDADVVTTYAPPPALEGFAAWDVAVDSAGAVVLVGDVPRPDAVDPELFHWHAGIVKFAATGEVLWSHEDDGEDDSSSWVAAVGPDDEVVVGGTRGASSETSTLTVFAP